METKRYTEEQLLKALESYYKDMINNSSDYKENITDPKQDAIDTFNQLKNYIYEN